MKQTSIILALCMCGYLSLSSCVESFIPDDLKDAQSVLVVEGNISLNGPFEIQLSRSTTMAIPAGGNREMKYENYANVYVVSQDGEKYPPLDNPVKEGRYAFDLSSLSLDESKQYHLLIETPKDNQAYESAPLTSQHSTDMTVGYVIDTISQEVRIHVSTYDPTGNSRFYTWRFEETWDYVSQLAAYCYFDGAYLMETPNPFKHRCWDSARSTDVIVLGTEDLSEDRVVDYVIQTIPFKDIRISQHYSILVTQTVLDKDAYEFYQNMRKNSNDIGSLFSPQPNEINGNIRCTTQPDLAVVGHVSVCSSVTKRIFVDCLHLPKSYFLVEEDKVLSLDAPSYEYIILQRQGYEPYTTDPMQRTVSWNKQRCVHCTYRGGIVSRPSYWPIEWPSY